VVTPKAFATFKPRVARVSALPWGTGENNFATLKGLPHRIACEISLRTLSEFDHFLIDVDPGRCPGLKFANAFGV